MVSIDGRTYLNDFNLAYWLNAPPPYETQYQNVDNKQQELIHASMKQYEKALSNNHDAHKLYEIICHDVSMADNSVLFAKDLLHDELHYSMSPEHDSYIVLISHWALSDARRNLHNIKLELIKKEMGFHRMPNLIKRGLETLLHAKKSRNKRIIDEATAFLKHRIHQYYEAKSSLPRMQKDFENCEKQANEIEAQYHKALLFGEQSATSAIIVDYILYSPEIGGNS